MMKNISGGSPRTGLVSETSSIAKRDADRQKWADRLQARREHAYKVECAHKARRYV